MNSLRLWHSCRRGVVRYQLSWEEEASLIESYTASPATTAACAHSHCYTISPRTSNTPRNNLGLRRLVLLVASFLLLLDIVVLLLASTLSGVPSRAARASLIIIRACGLSINFPPDRRVVACRSLRRAHCLPSLRSPLFQCTPRAYIDWYKAFCHCAYQHL